MGESKRRKETDKNYGSISNKKIERGIIISSPMIINERKMTIGGAHIDPTELRFSLLFWDKLAWPHNHFVNMNGNAETSYLVECGILSRPIYQVGGDMAESIAKGYIDTYINLEKKHPGEWTMAQSDRGLLLHLDTLENDKGASLELFRAIPIPRHDVALADILEFKLKRQDELFSFRHHIDQLTAKIKDSDTPEEDLRKAITEIDTVCSDLLKVSKEYQIPFYISDFKTSLNINPLKVISAAKKAWDLAEPYGMPAATAAAITAGGLSTLSFKSDYGFRPIKLPKSPYRYAYSIGKELI